MLKSKQPGLKCGAVSCQTINRYRSWQPTFLKSGLMPSTGCCSTGPLPQCGTEYTSAVRNVQPNSYGHTGLTETFILPSVRFACCSFFTCMTYLYTIIEKELCTGPLSEGVLVVWFISLL